MEERIEGRRKNWRRGKSEIVEEEEEGVRRDT